MIPMVPKRLLDQVAFTGDLSKPCKNLHSETDDNNITNISHSNTLKRQKVMF